MPSTHTKNTLRIMNSREAKRLRQMIEAQWGEGTSPHGVFLQNNSGKVYLASSDLSRLDLEKLRIESVGAYIAEVGEDIRLSIEGSQLIGPSATRNVAEVSEEDAKSWLKGQDLAINLQASGFVIIKQGKDFFGSGRYSRGRITNFVPKSRRTSEVI